MNDHREKHKTLDEKKNIPQDNKIDTTELQGKDAEYELFKGIFVNVQEGNQELERVQRESELMNKIEKKIKKLDPNLKIVNVSKTDKTVRKENIDIKELSEQKETTTEEETERMNIVSIVKKDKTNNLLRESTNNLRDDKRDELPSEPEQNNEGIRKDKSNKFYCGNLINEEFLELVKIYHNNNSEGRFANFGPKITQKFKNFVKFNQSLSDDKKRFFIETIEEINRNHEMTNLINLYLTATNYSQHDIAKEIRDKGYFIAPTSIGRIALRDIYKGNKKLYNERFSTRWSGLNKETAPKILMDAIIDVKSRLLEDEGRVLGEHEAPTIDDLTKYKYKGLLKAISRELGKTYNYMLRQLKLEVNHDVYKWRDLDEETALELIDKAITDVKEGLRKYEGLNLADNKAPTISQLNKYGYKKLIYALMKKEISYTELLKKLDYEINLDVNKWESLNKNTISEILENAIEQVREKLRKYEGIVLKEDQAPIVKYMVKYGFGGLIQAMQRRGFVYNERLVKLGLKINVDPQKWKDLNKDSAPKYLMNLIENVKESLEKFEGISLSDKQTPTIAQITKCGYKSLIDALYNRGISIIETEGSLNLFPNYADIFMEVGAKSHIIQEYLFMKNSRKKHCNSFWEAKTTIRDNQRRPDNDIGCDDTFRKKIESHQDILTIPENIKLINIDYLLSLSKESIKKKCRKGYHGREKWLILVSLLSKKRSNKLPRNLDIPYPKNVKILSPEEFAEFFGYEGQILEKFRESIHLTSLALYNSQARLELSKWAMKSRNILNQKYSYKTKEFLQYLRDKDIRHLSSEDPEFETLRKKDEYKRQAKIDEY